MAEQLTACRQSAGVALKAVLLDLLCTKFERMAGLPLRSCKQVNAEAARLPFFVVGVRTIQMWVGPLQLAWTALLSAGPGTGLDLPGNTHVARCNNFKPIDLRVVLEHLRRRRLDVTGHRATLILHPNAFFASHRKPNAASRSHRACKTSSPPNGIQPLTNAGNMLVCKCSLHVKPCQRVAPFIPLHVA